MARMNKTFEEAQDLEFVKSITEQEGSQLRDVSHKAILTYPLGILVRN